MNLRRSRKMHPFGVPQTAGIIVPDVAVHGTAVPYVYLTFTGAPRPLVRGGWRGTAAGDREPAAECATRTVGRLTSGRLVVVTPYGLSHKRVPSRIDLTVLIPRRGCSGRCGFSWGGGG
jgi:hypothetical protein